MENWPELGFFTLLSASILVKVAASPTPNDNPDTVLSPVSGHAVKGPEYQYVQEPQSSCDATGTNPSTGIFCVGVGCCKRNT